MPHLNIHPEILAYFENNDYQQDLKVLYRFVLKFSPTSFIFSKGFKSDISSIEVWFTDQNIKPLDIDDKINITLVINWCVTCKIRYQIDPRELIFGKGCGFLSFAKYMGKNIGQIINENVSGKCSQKLLYHAKETATNALKTASTNINLKNNRSNWWFNW